MVQLIFPQNGTDRLYFFKSQHRASACIIISSPIAGKENGRSKCCVRLLFDQPGSFQVSTDGISFQVNGGSNVMGGKTGGATELNPMIIRCRSNPDELPLDERAGLPEPNMSPVLDIISGLLKGQVLDSAKEIERTDRGRWVTSVSQAVNRDFLGGVAVNQKRNQPSGLVKAVQDLRFRPDQDQVHRVSIRSCPGVGNSWQGREIEAIRVKADERQAGDHEHEEHTYHAQQ